MKFASVILFLFGISTWLGPVKLSLIWNRYVQEINAYPIVQAEITEILEVEMGKGRYLGKVVNNPEASIQNDTLYGLDFLGIHAIGDQVEVSLGPKRRVVDKASWIPFMFFILVFTGLAAALTIFFYGVITKKTYHPLLLKSFFVICFSLSVVMFAMFRYFYSQQGHFFSNAQETEAVLVDFRHKICEHKSGDREGEEYDCYSKVYEYKIADGTQYKHNAKHYSAEKKGNIGDRVRIYYRSDYPAQAQIMNRKISYFILAIPIFFGSLFLWAAYGLFGKIREAK